MGEPPATPEMSATNYRQATVRDFARVAGATRSATHSHAAASRIGAARPRAAL
jgi:hypothetical protein